MITNEQRRKVAQELRKRSYQVSVQSVQSILCEVLEVGGANIFGRLADLIEPDGKKVECVAEIKIDGNELEEIKNRAITECTGVDRSALLNLADEMDNTYKVPDVAHDYAKRIRKAIGVYDG